jgi:hypothetical protein
MKPLNGTVTLFADVTLPEKFNPRGAAWAVADAPTRTEAVRTKSLNAVDKPVRVIAIAVSGKKRRERKRRNC